MGKLTGLCGCSAGLQSLYLPAIFFTVLYLVSPIIGVHASQPPRIGPGDSAEGIVYVAVVIHMNQLLENLHVTEAYGVPAYETFKQEARIPLEVPGAKLVVDVTGPTLISMMATAPDIIDDLRRGVSMGRTEILGITFGQIPVQYLPLSHVEKHVEYEERLIKTLFNTTPRGLWQEDRQWTPNLPYIITRLGYEYTLIDDNVYFRGNPGADPYDVYYPHIAEYNGSRIIVFHISKYMRYHLRDYSSIQDIKDYLKDILRHTRNRAIPPIIVYGDDAEFGLDPRVIQALAQEPWIKFTTLSEYIDRYNDYFTPANYNVTGAYEEYESMFGRNWDQWYSQVYAKNLVEEFMETSKKIEALWEGEKWLIDPAWTALLLAEWQYGPFYKFTGETNREYLVDATIYTILGTLNNETSGNYTEERIMGHRIGLYVKNEWGITIDYDRNTIRTIINYKTKSIYTPLMYFDTKQWWRFNKPGISFKDIDMYSGEIHGDKLVVKTSTGAIEISINNDVLLLKLPSKTMATIRLVPGNYFNYTSYRFPAYYYTRMNNSYIISDEYGNTLEIGVEPPAEINNEGFNVKLTINTGYITIRVPEEKAATGTPISYTPTSRAQQENNRAATGTVIIAAISILALTAIILAAVFLAQRK